MAEARSGAAAPDHRAGRDVERTVANAPVGQWTWPYGAVVLVLLALWYLLPVGWLWVVLAFVAGVLVSLRTWSEARPSHAEGAR